MLCQQCGNREALVHLTKTDPELGSGAEELGKDRQHFCEQCADGYFANTPGMNAMRDLICLSDSYRSRLYDLLEELHPEVFDINDGEACHRGSETMTKFLQEHLKQDGVEVSGDAFDMLCHDFICSHHFYTRSDEFNEKNGRC
jgi:protein-arginine kinase activator protein McsA